jgi:hypothetical protein
VIAVVLIAAALVVIGSLVDWGDGGNAFDTAVFLGALEDKVGESSSDPAVKDGVFILLFAAAAVGLAFLPQGQAGSSLLLAACAAVVFSLFFLFVRIGIEVDDLGVLDVLKAGVYITGIAALGGALAVAAMIGRPIHFALVFVIVGLGALNGVLVDVPG